MLRGLLETAPPGVVVYTAFTTAEVVTDSYLAGADSFVHKGAEPECLLAGIRATAAGRGVWAAGADPAERERGAAAALSGDGARQGAARAPVAGLTPREREVLALLLQRCTNAEIAAELYLGLPTVKTHVSHVLHKLGLAGRQDLLARGPITQAAHPSPGPHR